MRILATFVSLLVAAAALVLPVSLPWGDFAWGAAPALVAVALLCAVVVALLPRAMGDATPLISTCLAALAAGSALVVLALSDGERPFRYWILAPAVATLVAFATQLLRGTGAKGRTESLSSAIATIMIGTSGAGWYVAQTIKVGNGGLWVAVIGAVIGLAAALALAARGKTSSMDPGQESSSVATWVMAGAAGIVAVGAPVALLTTVLADRFSWSG